MQATISGVTPKISIHSREKIQDFLDSEKVLYTQLSKESCLYSDKFILSSNSLNYLNYSPKDKVESSIKNLILKEFNRCESLYPYLGDYFLESFYKNKHRKPKREERFNKIHEKRLINSINNINVKNISKWIIENISLERSLNIETYSGHDILVEPVDDFLFDFEFDFEFYKNNSGLQVKDYFFIIIDGYIESVGEIHHLMFNANKNKRPYVVFCHGMSDEVKYNIAKNNKEGRTQILPVSIDFNENTLNILNDLAVVHDSFVVSSKLGQTISQEIRKELPVGKKISFYKNKVIIKSVANDKKIYEHRKFLKKRINEALLKTDVNVDPIKNRLKNFNVKSANIYIPNELNRDKDANRELDYFLRVVSNLSKKMCIINTDFRKNYFVPSDFIKLAEQKVNSLKEMLYNIDKIIV